MAKTKESQLKASRKWKASHKEEIAKTEERTTKVQIRLNKDNDKDIISKLDSVDNKQGYIKGLIRNDIAKSN